MRFLKAFVVMMGLFLLVAAVSFAQPAPQPSVLGDPLNWAKGIVGIVCFVWGMLCKNNRRLAGIPNGTIPYVNTLLFFLTAMAGATDANAAGLGGLFAKGGLGATLLLACWDSVKVTLVYEVFGRHALKGAGIEKKSVDGLA